MVHWDGLCLVIESPPVHIDTSLYGLLGTDERRVTRSMKYVVEGPPGSEDARILLQSDTITMIVKDYELWVFNGVTHEWQPHCINLPFKACAGTSFGRLTRKCMQAHALISDDGEMYMMWHDACKPNNIVFKRIMKDTKLKAPECVTYSGFVPPDEGDSQCPVMYFAEGSSVYKLENFEVKTLYEFDVPIVQTLCVEKPSRRVIRGSHDLMMHDSDHWLIVGVGTRLMVLYRDPESKRVAHIEVGYHYHDLSSHYAVEPPFFTRIYEPGSIYPADMRQVLRTTESRKYSLDILPHHPIVIHQMVGGESDAIIMEASHLCIGYPL